MRPDEEQIVLHQLRQHEGMRTRPYRDSVGKLTIGIGRNLDDIGISPEEAVVLCLNDIGTADRMLTAAFNWYPSLVGDRKYALVNMCFNLGLTRLKKFRKMIAALEHNDFDTAAKEALDSKWAKQVGNRADEIAEQIRMG